jgi:putative transposase
MKRSRFSEEQIIWILREVQGGWNTRAVCAAQNISEGTYHAWKRNYGRMDVSEARQLQALETRTRGSSALVPISACRTTP